MHRAFRKIALGGGRPVKPGDARPVDERIDKGREIRLCVLAKTAALARGKRPGERGRKHHFFDAKTRIDGLELLGQEFCEPGGVAQRLGGADADRLDALIDPVKKEIEAARPKASALQRFAERCGKFCRMAGKRLRRADRFGKGAANMDVFGRADWPQRLGKAAKGLIETAQRRLAKAPRQGRAGRCCEIADCLKPQPLQAKGKSRIQAQRRHGQGGDGNENFAGRGDCRLGPKPGKRMRRADRIGKTRACMEVYRLKPGQEVAQQRFFAAKKMRGAFDVDQKPVRRIRGNERAIAAQRPKRQPAERRPIGRGIGGSDRKTGHARLRLGERKTWLKAKRERHRVDRNDNAAAAVLARKNERFFRRGRFLVLSRVRTQNRYPLLLDTL